MADIWEKVQKLQGRTLHTLYQGKPFEILKVTDNGVQLMPLGGKRKRRSVLRNRIEHLADLRLHRDELRKRVLEAYPTSQNTSYYAAIVHEISQG
jgi:hypothetical protein